MTNYGDLRYNAWGGGVPIVYQGQTVGAVGVSGLSETEDMELAKWVRSCSKKLIKDRGCNGVLGCRR